MRPGTAAFLIAALYVLHQDFWFWREARPLVFGFLPIGLFYHAVFTSICALVLWLLVEVSWPAHLEGVAPDLPPSRPWRFGEPRRSSPKTGASVGGKVRPTSRQ